MIRIVKEKCTRCGLCAGKCPFNALEMEEGFPVVQENCLVCGLCADVCPVQAIIKGDKVINGQELSEYKDVFVAAELDPVTGKLQKVTLELVSEGRRIADKLGENLKVILLCAKMPPEFLKRTGSLGCDEVILVEDDLLKEYNTDIYADVIEKICREYKPAVLFMPATETGRDLAPRVSAKLETGLTADCTGFDVDKDRNLVQIRPTYGGNIMASIISPGHRPQMASVRPNVFIINKEGQEKEAVLTEASIKTDPARKRTFRKEIKENPKSYKNVAESEVVIVAGYGVGNEENFKKIERLAVKMGAALGATRKVVDEGWAPFDIQVGQTGKTIAPDLYISFGVSGALQHTIGIRNAKHVVAVNNDPAAPIFGMCEAVLGDCVAVAQEIEKLL